MKKTTSLFILVFVVVAALVLIVYDVYAIKEGGTEASISFVVFEWSYKYPLFTWACGFFPGVLVGHFFWRISDTPTTKRITDFVKGRSFDGDVQ